MVVVKIYLNDLYNIAREKVYPVDIDVYEVKDNLFLRRLEDVRGDISFYYDAADELRINYAFSGKMICPCALTLEDVELPFDLEDDEKVVNDPNEDGFFLERSMEVEEMVLYIVIPEVPIKVVKNEKIEYSRGDGWVFVSEKDYDSSLKERVDPRLQKLKELKLEEDD